MWTTFVILEKTTKLVPLYGELPYKPPMAQAMEAHAPDFQPPYEKKVTGGDVRWCGQDEHSVSVLACDFLSEAAVKTQIRVCKFAWDVEEDAPHAHARILPGR